MGYQPIENYGLIGDMHTAALVGMNGSIDWLCFPHFDSPSIFAAILDEEKGGRFFITPLVDNVNNKQFYWPETNILITQFLSDSGVAEIIDFMPVEKPGSDFGKHELIRRIRVIRGSYKFRLVCRPAFDYARKDHDTRISEHGACFRTDDLHIGLSSNFPLKAADKGVVAEFEIPEGTSTSFVLHEVKDDDQCAKPISEEASNQLFEQTVAYWRHWIGQCTYNGRWRETVHRSALAMKLMTFEPTGAIVASPTCSLPEVPGGERNWDYRYTWIRDAAFTLYGFMRIGFTEEASRFMEWLVGRCADMDPEGGLKIMYSIHGDTDLEETTLDHLEGYRGAGPVRIGNNAYQQLQLDIYGELMDSVYLYNKYGTPISYDFWQTLRRLLNWLCDHWQEKDQGVWETRAGRQHFVYSKLMCWVALDRGIRLANKRSFPADHARWLRVRDQIYEEIMSKGWSDSKQSFVQYYGSDSLDASTLIMPLVFFLSPTDPRMLSTIDVINRPPDEGGLASDHLVYRYNLDEFADGLEGKEGTFNLCTFWLVEALTRAGQRDPRRLEDARLMFEEMLGYSNHLGLFSEQTGHLGEALGNYPQALTHLSLISAAFNLNRVLGEQD